MFTNLPCRFSTHYHLLPPLSFLSRIFSTHQTIPLHDHPNQSYMELTQKFYESMKQCSSIRSVPTAQNLHAQLVVSGLDSSTFLQNHLINMYSNCGLVDDAFIVFDGIGFDNVFSWNIMINGFLDSGRVEDAENLFDEMPERDGVSWNSMMSGYFRNGNL